MQDFEEKQHKNRLYFDAPPSHSREREGSAYVFGDEPARPDDVILNERLEDLEERKRKRLRYILAGGLLLLVLAAIVLLTLYFLGLLPWKWGGSTTGASSFQWNADHEESARLRDRFYIPEGKYSPDLTAAIQLYKTNMREEAKRAFEKFVESGAEDGEKAVALSFLGIMAMETERWPLAKHQLFRALKYDPESVSALVNLAITEKRLGNLADAMSYAKKARELAPRDSRVGILLGNLLVESNEVGEGVDAYRNALKNNPEDPLLYYNLALTLMRQNSVEEAIRNFSKAIEFSGGGELASKSHAHLGQIYFSRGNLELAADHLHSASTLAPNNGRFRYNLGVVYLRMNRNNDALSEFQKALDAMEGDAEVYRGLALAFQKMKQPSLAIRSLEKAIYTNPQDIQSMFLLGDIYAGEKDLLKAAATYRKIINITPGNQDTVDALIKLGAVDMELERHQDAVDAYRRALQLAPDRAEAMFGLGSAYHAAGMTDRAVAIWRSALQKTDGNDHGSGYVLDRDDEKMIRMSLAAVYRNEGAYEMALNEYRLIRALDNREPVLDEDPALDEAVGETYLSMKDHGGAARSFQRIIDSRSATAEQRKSALLHLATSYSSENSSMQDLDAARSYANRAARLAPDDPSSRIVQAEVLLKSGSSVDREKAIEILRAISASDVPPEISSRAYTLLGQAYMKNGEYSRAVRSLDYAVQLDPSNSEAYRYQKLAASAYEESLRH